MGLLCCKKDGAVDKQENMNDTPTPTEPLLDASHTSSSAVPSERGETKQNGPLKQDHHNHHHHPPPPPSSNTSGYAPFSLDVRFKVPDTERAAVIPVPFSNAFVPEVVGVAFGGSLSNFPFSVPSPTARMQHSSSFSSDDGSPRLRRHRSTTHMSYFEPECIICFETFSPSNPRVASKCNCNPGVSANAMHLGCLLQWTEQEHQQDQLCPVCRGHIEFEGSD
jgi:hypothetical protein